MSRIASRGERRERLGLDLEERAPRRLEGGHALGGEEPVGRVVGAEREQLGVLERGDLSHAVEPTTGHPPRKPLATVLTSP